VDSPRYPRRPGISPGNKEKKVGKGIPREKTGKIPKEKKQQLMGEKRGGESFYLVFPAGGQSN